MEEKKKSGRGILFFIILIILVLLLVIGGLIWYILTSKNAGDGEEDAVESAGKLAYDTAVVVDNPDALQQAVDGLIQQAAEGTMAVQMKLNARSEDGSVFSCEIGNAEENRYDMFVIIYRDDTMEEIYRSGLIPVGTHIESFTTNEPLEPGNYEATIVYNQVEDDRETIHSQVNVGLTLIVSE